MKLYNPYQPEPQVFKRWLKKNGNHLRNYAPDQVAQVALACGFPIETICPGVIDHVALLGRLVAFWENPLSEKWLRLARYDNGMESEDRHA